MQLALGDALAFAAMDLRGVGARALAALHPGGAIGLAQAPVSELMHRGDLPLVARDTPMADVIRVITGGRFGLAGVVAEDGALAGVITDGDLRRHVAVLGRARAGQVMTAAPLSLNPDMAGRTR
jgi:arabinose-5-phosphate isomerase